MADSAWFVLAIVLVALAFDFVNGFHDAANSIATVVSTRVLSPSAAVVWAATFNFIAVFVFGTAVAKTMGKGLVDLAIVDATVILAGLVGRSCGTSSPGGSDFPPRHPTRSSEAMAGPPWRRRASRLCYSPESGSLLWSSSSSHQ